MTSESTDQLFRPAGSITDGNDPVLITPQRAGWDFSGLRVVALEPGESRMIDLGPMEGGVLPLSGACTVTVDSHRYPMEGRPDVFSRVSDFLYLPRGTSAEIRSTGGGEFAIPMSVATRVLPVRHVPAEDVAVEVRGAGQVTRQVNNFASAATFDGADKMIAVEVITPSGNWSSFPPHKHDEHTETEVPLEEIYYFRIDERDAPGVGDGFGLHRTYTADGVIDATVTVRDGDVFLIPRGFHGPCVATPGYHMYYLNVMAGPLPDRSWLICDDPAHAWVKESWEGVDPDPRLPLYDAGGPRI